MISQEAREYFKCDFADILVPLLRNVNGERQAEILSVEGNIACVSAPLTLMNQVFLRVDRQLKERGVRPTPPILL